MGKRRGRNEGTIFHHDRLGLWVAAVSVHINGKRKRRVAYAKTRGAAAERLKALLNQNDEGTHGPVSETVAGYLARWLKLIEAEVKPRSLAKFEQVIRLHILPTLGRIKLAKLSALEIQELITTKAQAGMAPQSLLHLRNTLRNALNRAIRLDHLARNPAARVEVPRLPDRRVETLSAADAQQLLESAKESRLNAFYVLALATGARRGELLGLKWSDLDLNNGRLTITRALQRVEGQGLQLTETKSRAACRTVILPQFAIVALRLHHSRQLAERLAAGPDWRNESELAFTGRDGQPLEPIAIHRDFKAILRRSGLPLSRRIHDLRHSTATFLLMKGVPLKLVQDQLGHSSIAVTSALYAHVADELRQQAAGAMDELFNPSRKVS